MKKILIRFPQMCLILLILTNMLMTLAQGKTDSTFIVCGKIADWQEVGDEGISLEVFKNYQSQNDAILGEEYQLVLDRDSFHLAISFADMPKIFYGRFNGLIKRGENVMIGFPFLFQA